MANPDEQLLADLKRDTNRRLVRILAVVGIVLLAVGGGLLALGLTYDEPPQRLATKSVPRGAEIALIVAGALSALVGVAMLLRSVIALRSKRG
jgi:hypothetical protein